MLGNHGVEGNHLEAETLVVASCYRNRSKPRPDVQLGSKAHLAFTELLP